MQRYKTIQLLKDNKKPPKNPDPFDWFKFNYCKYIRIELGRILNKKSDDIKPEDFRAIDKVTKWGLCLSDSDIAREYYNRLLNKKHQITEEKRNPTKDYKPKKGSSFESRLKELESERDALIFKLDKLALYEGAVRTFFVNMLSVINDINDNDKGTAKFRIGEIGSFNQNVYVKDVWNLIPIKKLVKFLSIYGGEWNGCGINYIDKKGFRDELIHRFTYLIEIEPEDLSKVYDVHKAVFEDKTFYIQSKRIEPTSYKTYHRNVIPFKLHEIRVDSSLTEAKEIKVKCPDTGEDITKIVYPELEKAINKLGRIGKVLGNLFRHRPDYINCCQGIFQTYCYIKSDQTRVIIIIGTSNDGKSTFRKLMFKIGSDIWGKCKFDKIFGLDDSKAGGNYDKVKHKYGLWDDEIRTKELDATRLKEDTRSTSRNSELKYINQFESENRFNIFGNCNEPPKWNEVGRQVDNRLLYLQSYPSDFTKDSTLQIGEYHDSFSPDEERELLKHILQVGGVRAFQGKLGYSENQASIDRINEFKTDILSAVFGEFELTARPSNKRPYVRKSILELVIGNYIKERQWRGAKSPKDLVNNEVNNKFPGRVIAGDNNTKKRFVGWPNTGPGSSTTPDYVMIDIGKQKEFLELAYREDKKNNLRTYYDLEGKVKRTELINPVLGEQTKAV